MLRFKKHIAILSLLLLFLPTAVLTAHLFENHEHTVCTSTNEQHYHSQDIDCSLDHYQFTIYTYQSSDSFVTEIQHYYKQNYTTQNNIVVSAYTQQKSSRAPPYFTV